jgi:hypothetical protein
MDNPSSESSALDANQAAELFSSLGEEPKQEDPVVDTELDLKPKEEASEEAEPIEDDGVEITVDGKPIKLSKAELAEAVKGQMRQADYTRKTMEVADQRKEASAEIDKARNERNNYQQALGQQAAALQALMGEQQRTDWDALLNSDPVEYMKQKHLLERRQAALAQNVQQQQYIQQQQQAEAQEYRSRFVSQQQDELLAKLPEWKDEGKAKAEKSALSKYLTDFGYSNEEVSGITDHKAVLLARNSMLYEQMVAKASAATKKVENLPKRVERPSVGEANPSVDRRGQAWARLNKSGRAEDAASLLSSFLS